MIAEIRLDPTCVQTHERSSRHLLARPTAAALQPPSTALGHCRARDCSEERGNTSAVCE